MVSNNIGDLPQQLRPGISRWWRLRCPPSLCELRRARIALRCVMPRGRTQGTKRERNGKRRHCKKIHNRRSMPFSTPRRSGRGRCGQSRPGLGQTARIHPGRDPDAGRRGEPVLGRHINSHAMLDGRAGTRYSSVSWNPPIFLALASTPSRRRPASLG
jgi:hypothetical protein